MWQRCLEDILAVETVIDALLAVQYSRALVTLPFAAKGAPSLRKATHLRCMAAAVAEADADAGITLLCGSYGDVGTQSWVAVAAQQHQAQLDFDFQTFIERAQCYPTVYAFKDRNCLTQELRRRIFIVLCGEGSDAFVFVFNTWLLSTNLRQG